MKQKELAPAVVFMFYKEGQVLLEKRPATSSYPEEWIFPGGKVETSDEDLTKSPIISVRKLAQDLKNHLQL